MNDTYPRPVDDSDPCNFHSNGSLAVNETDDQYYQAADELRRVYIWVLFVLGVPGNMAAVVTILSMRVTTATFYVALLAVVDGVTLVMKLIVHQLNIYGMLPLSGMGCRVLTMVGELCSCYASWVLVLICFERFVSVRFPLRKRVCFTNKRAYASAVILFVAMFTSFSPFLYVEGYCDDIRRPYRDLEYKDLWLALQVLLYFVLPFIVVAVLVVLIIVYLRRHRLSRQALQHHSTAGDDGGGTELAMSIMLVSAAIAFLVMTLPTCVYYLIGQDRIEKEWCLSQGAHYLFYEVTTVLADANHAVNFYIYFISAAKFRNRFLELMRGVSSRCCLKGRSSVHEIAGPHTMDTCHSAAKGVGRC